MIRTREARCDRRCDRSLRPRHATQASHLQVEDGVDAPTERGTKEKSGDAVLRFDRGFEKSAKARTAAEQAMLDELGAHSLRLPSSNHTNLPP